MANENLYLGCHVSMSGPDYYLGSVKEALSYEANTFMFYTGAPQNTIRLPLERLKISEGRALIKESGIDESKIVVHAPYIINIANQLNVDNYELGKRHLLNEIQRTYAFGPKILVLHPGSHVSTGVENGIDSIVKALNEVLDKDGTDVKIALETMAGKGSEMGTSFEQFKEIISKLKDTKAPIIGYDQYTQCHDKYAHPEEGIKSYFYDLDMFRKITKEYDVPVYISLLCIGHWNHRVPTEDDIRWQMYTALAHGMRGIIWFYFHQPHHDYSYRGGPYTNFGMRKTPMFDIIARQQYIFKEGYEEQFNKMELINVYHLNDNYVFEDQKQKDEDIDELILDREFPVIISHYQEFDSKKKWISFVNGSQEYTNLFRVTFKGGNKKVFWLAPGEMRLFDLDEVTK